ncbi:antibiotic biosynthesis monooxygenase [Acinetobacter sp. B5B]|uniref:putative quinol monooxygenase n=1 Tax=Acinetobacter baretiae TaxID=2605383 RepID=UPI0018C26790|nr:antibiotic biosynthesis monooxygenase [Acinetobacter baretiae]MBF7681951.1 antibiotic biosynthesis monooxygenase [Acinetobacter baretiae]MBF7685677.1 antibiotic biosynthesis monooxygenase [Acinetobacter baretiae]
MSLVHILATISFSHEHLEKGKQKLIEVLAPSRAEHGNVSYLLFQDQSDPHCFIFQEIWQSTTAFEMHQKTSHFLNLFNYLKVYAQSVDIKTLADFNEPFSED